MELRVSFVERRRLLADEILVRAQGAVLRAELRDGHLDVRGDACSAHGARRREQRSQLRRLFREGLERRLGRRARRFRFRARRLRARELSGRERLGGLELGGGGPLRHVQLGRRRRLDCLPLGARRIERRSVRRLLLLQLGTQHVAGEFLRLVAGLPFLEARSGAPEGLLAVGELPEQVATC